MTSLNPPATEVECSTCRGTGEVVSLLPDPLDEYDTAPCRRCHGTGRVEVLWCGRSGCPRPAVPGVHARGVNLCAGHHDELRNSVFPNS